MRARDLFGRRDTEEVTMRLQKFARDGLVDTSMSSATCKHDQNFREIIKSAFLEISQ